MAETEFFKAGRTYGAGQNGYTAPELTTIFHVEHVTRHPDRGTLRAIGWARTGKPSAEWHGHFEDEGSFADWEELSAEYAPAKGGPVGQVRFRADHDGIPMESYSREAAARTHCEAHIRREWPDCNVDWIVDEEDGVAELTVWVGGEECVTGYTVTAVPVPSEYDAEADDSLDHDPYEDADDGLSNADREQMARDVEYRLDAEADARNTQAWHAAEGGDLL